MSSNRSWGHSKRAWIAVPVFALAALLSASAAQAIPAPPQATTGPATNITQTGATLTGTVDPNEDATTWHFQWRQVGASTWNTTTGGTVTGANPVPVSESITGLQPNTQYEYQLMADNSLSATPVSGGISTFTTRPRPTISINDVIAPEGNSGTVGRTLTVRLSEASSQTVTVNYFTFPGGGAQEGVDYTGVSGTLTFVPGDTQEPITVPVHGDTVDETDEVVFVNLTNATNATIADGQGTLTIDDDDGPTIAIGDVNEPESTLPPEQATQNPFQFVVALSSASPQQVRVSYVTVPDTATPGEDYRTASGTLVFAPGETQKTVAVEVIGDQ